MSLIHFHRVLIALGILFCFGFAGWDIWARGFSLLSLVFIFLGLGLGYYLLNLNRFLGIDNDADIGHDAKE